MLWERCCSMEECLNRDRRVLGFSLTGVTALCTFAKHSYPCLVLAKPRKTHPDITERLLTRTLRIKSDVKNQIKQKRNKEACLLSGNP